MARKSALTFERRPTYADWPECLLNFAWLLDQARTDARRMYNPAWRGTHPSCKVCGATVPFEEWERHRDQHLEQLGAPKTRKRKEIAPVMVDGFFATDEVLTVVGKLQPNPVLDPVVPLPEYDQQWHIEVMQLIEDSLSDKQEGIEFELFGAELAERISDQIIHDTSEQSAGSPAFCADCQ